MQAMLLGADAVRLRLTEKLEELRFFKAETEIKFQQTLSLNHEYGRRKCV